MKGEEVTQTTIEEPGWTNLMFDSQVLNTFMGCQREMELRFIRHFVPKGGVSPAYHKGTLIHKGLQVFYDGMQKGLGFTERRSNGNKAMRMLAPTLGLDTEHILDTYRTFEEYVEFRKNDVFQVIFTERLFRIIIYENYPLRIVIYGRIDMGILDNSGSTILPMDHKSESESWFYSTLTNQFKMYALASKSNRLIVNRIGFQSSVKADKKFKREDLNFDANMLDEFKNEMLPYYAKQMLIAREDNFYPPNYANCIKGHWGCIFSDKFSGGVCNLDPKEREQKLKLHFIQKEWDPQDDA